MSKKVRGNGEGTIYDTVQKIKKEFDNTQMCKICAECSDKTLCNGRKDWTKCDKCKNCKGDKSCDRFYIYKKTFAQITTKNGRKTVGNGKNKKEVNVIKNEQEAKLKIMENIKHGDLTLEETMKENEKQKLKNNEITENTYFRNMETINTICSHPISQLKMINITENDIKESFKYFIDLDTSQSQLDMNFDRMKGAFRLCKLNTMDDLKRSLFLSNVEPKNIVAFTIDEEKQLIKYVNKNEKQLINSKKSKIDAKTVKNIIKFALATGMRIGEICSLDKDRDIDKEHSKVIVRTTLTKNTEGKVIIGKGTKTARKKKIAGKKDIRYIPFDVLFDKKDFVNMLDEQLEISAQNENNINNLLFCNIDGSFITHNAFNAIFKRICRNANIKLDLVQGCNTHMTKHTAVTRMIENGIRIEVVSAIVGTTAEVLRKTYAHILDKFIEEEIKQSKSARKKHNIKLS